jgi:intron-binding protein aquarius
MLLKVVGPPGTGKTDVAVQLISNLYHSFPEERILIVTHSNHALNDIFVKISQVSDIVYLKDSVFLILMWRLFVERYRS